MVPPGHLLNLGGLLRKMEVKDETGWLVLNKVLFPSQGGLWSAYGLAGH